MLFIFADMRDMRKFVLGLNKPKREQWGHYAKCWEEEYCVVILKRKTHSQLHCTRTTKKLVSLKDNSKPKLPNLLTNWLSRNYLMALIEHFSVKQIELRLWILHSDTYLYLELIWNKIYKLVGEYIVRYFMVGLTNHHKFRKKYEKWKVQSKAFSNILISISNHVVLLNWGVRK